MIELDKKLANLSIKVQLVNIFGDRAYVVSVATTELTNGH